jgi:hypothetical protein
MFRKSVQVFASLAAILLAASAQTPGSKSVSAEQKKPAGTTMTDAQKIALAVSAGPAAITKNAAVIDMTDMPNSKHKRLRAGTNGWACYAMVDTPMCLDKEWQKWMGKTKPNITSTGVAYMLRGDNGTSNIDPYATAPTPTNQWVVAPAHIMLVYPDPKMLDTYPTDPKNGGPWVMWKGTPYAHVMVPVSPTEVATMKTK